MLSTHYIPKRLREQAITHARDLLNKEVLFQWDLRQYIGVIVDFKSYQVMERHQPVRYYRFQVQCKRLNSKVWIDQCDIRSVLP